MPKKVSVKEVLEDSISRLQAAINWAEASGFQSNLRMFRQVLDDLLETMLEVDDIDGVLLSLKELAVRKGFSERSFYNKDRMNCFPIARAGQADLYWLGSSDASPSVSTPTPRQITKQDNDKGQKQGEG